MGFWLGQLFHLVSHAGLLWLFYWIIFRLPAVLRAPFKGIPKRVLGESVRVLHARNNGDGEIYELQVEWEVPSRTAFLLRPENWFDRLCKSLRLIKEVQLGAANFDQAMYLHAPAACKSWRRRILRHCNGFQACTSDWPRAVRAFVSCAPRQGA